MQYRIGSTEAEISIDWALQRLIAVLARLYMGKDQYRLGFSEVETSAGWALQRQRLA